MSRKSRILITLLTAAITFGSLFAIAGDTRSSYGQHKHCGDRSWQKNPNNHQEKSPTVPMPKPTNK